MHDDTNPPLTEEQLAFFTEQTRCAVNKALRRYVRGAVVGFLVLLAGIGAVRYADKQDNKDARAAIVQSGNAVSVDGCNRDFKTVAILRGVLESSRTFQEAALKRGDITEAQFANALRFYEEQLTALRLPDCRDALQTLTDEPGAPVKMPTPLHEDSATRHEREDDASDSDDLLNDRG